MRWMAMGVILGASVAAAGEVVELDARQLDRAGVVVGSVEERGFGDSQRVVGQVIRVPGSTLSVKAVIPGRVENLQVAPGDRVRAGQLLSALHSHERLQRQAEAVGANAILNVRFSTSSVAQGAAEIYVYGTAVRLE